MKNYYTSMMFLRIFLFLAAVITNVICTHVVLKFGKIDIQKCLIHYKLLGFKENNKGLDYGNAIRAAITLYQRRFHLPPTGVADTKTLALMKSQNCHIEQKWHSKSVFYMFSSNAPKNSFNGNSFNALHAAEFAFNMFSGVKDCYLRYETVNPSWLIDFVLCFDLGNQTLFNESSKVAVEQWNSSSRLHLNDNKNWEANWNAIESTYTRSFKPKGPDFIKYMLFYGGKIMGLKENNITGSIMNTADLTRNLYTPYQLSAYDEEEMASLGYKECWAPKITTVFSNYINDGQTYFIIGRLAYRLNDTTKTVLQTWPRPTNKVFGNRQLPKFIDEAFTFYFDGLVYFFKDHEYYVLKDKKIIKSIHNISTGWPGLPERIDAAFLNIDFDTYFFRGELAYLWNYFPNDAPGPYPKQGKVKDGWPKKIVDVFPKAPTHIDSAMLYYRDGRVYFFKGRCFWIWHETYDAVDGPYELNKHFKHLCETYSCVGGGSTCEGWRK